MKLIDFANDKRLNRLRRTINAELTDWRPDKTDEPTQPTQPDKTDETDETDKPDKTDKTDKPDNGKTPTGSCDKPSSRESKSVLPLGEVKVNGRHRSPP